MRKRLGSRRIIVLSAIAVWIAGCGLDADLPNRGGDAAPLSTAVMVSGAGRRDDPDAGSGASSRITDIRDDSGKNSRAADGQSGGTDSGGAFGEGVETGGAALNSSGAAGAGGRKSHPASGNTGRGGGAGTAGTASSSASAGKAGTGAVAGSAASAPPTLWFSEYVEGASSNKALEIATLERAVLDGCKVSTYFNGKTEATVVASLSGVLEAGQVLTVCTSQLKERLGEVCQQVGNLTFNGDDVVTLSCNGEFLDVIGQIGVDPGVAWGTELNGTADHTLRRNCTVQIGDSLGTDAFDPALDWQAFPMDTFDGLGTRGC